MQKVLNTIYVETPQGLQKKFPVKSIPLSALYDNGFFISEIFGTEAWIIDGKTYESQTKYILSPISPSALRQIQRYASKQYKRFCYLVNHNICRFAD